MSRLVVSIILVILSLTATTGIYWYYKTNFPTYSWHQKITVKIETPEGIKTGSSVIKQAYAYHGRTIGNAHEFLLRGEAPVVDLGNGRYVFALVTANGMEYAVFEALHKKLGFNRARYKEMAALIVRYKDKVNLSGRSAPMLVTFADVNDPMTVKQVDPKDLAASFGEGYSLKSIMLEITDAPMTKGRVEKVLGWLARLEGGYLHGGFTSKGAPLGLSGGAFKAGEY